MRLRIGVAGRVRVLVCERRVIGRRSHLCFDRSLRRAADDLQTRTEPIVYRSAVGQVSCVSIGPVQLGTPIDDWLSARNWNRLRLLAVCFVSSFACGRRVFGALARRVASRRAEQREEAANSGSKVRVRSTRASSEAAD